MFEERTSRLRPRFVESRINAAFKVAIVNQLQYVIESLFIFASHWNAPYCLNEFRFSFSDFIILKSLSKVKRRKGAKRKNF